MLLIQPKPGAAQQKAERNEKGVEEMEFRSHFDAQLTRNRGQHSALDRTQWAEGKHKALVDISVVVYRHGLVLGNNLWYGGF